MKVLIIEEDSFVRAVYESELRQENIEVIVAKNGGEGLELAKKTLPDLIITELILTKINGFELIKLVKADKKLSKIPVVVASELGQNTDIEEVMALGINKYMHKDLYSSKQIVKEVLNIMMSSL